MIKLVLTCGTCPEAYDAFDGDRLVGYLRLRHGRFTVECPNVGGDLVYEAHPEGDGIFETNERGRHLKFAVDRIQKWIHNGCKALPEEPTPDVEFEMVGNPEYWGSATPRATVSSKGRGRSVADLIEHFEKVAPEAVQKKGLSSAAFRAGELESLKERKERK